MLEQRNVYTRLITTALSFLVFIQTRTKTVNENPLFKIKCLLDMFAWHVCLISIRKVDLLNAVCVNKVRVAFEEFCSTKAGEIPDTKPSTCRATLFRCKFLSMFPVFHLARSTCPATKTFVAGWRKVLWKVERWSTLSNKFWLCCSFFIELTTCHATNAAILDPQQANQPTSALHFFNPHQILLLRDRLITQSKKRETSTQNLQRNNVAGQSEGFCISYFAALINLQVLK